MKNTVLYFSDNVSPVKIEVDNFDEKLLRLSDNKGYYTIIRFSDFEEVAKCFYAAYKKYKYVFEKGGK